MLSTCARSPDSWCWVHLLPPASLSRPFGTLAGRVRSSCQRGTGRWTSCMPSRSPSPRCLPGGDSTTLAPVNASVMLQVSHNVPDEGTCDTDK